MRITLQAATAADTRAAGGALASLLQGGDVLSLGGELGAGKTTFAQGVVAGLGVTDPVVSPTFTLVREYQGRLSVHHFDVYRLERIQEVIDLGLQEIVDADGLVLVEWGDAIEALLPERALDVTFAIGDDDERTIEIEAEGEGWAARWERLEAVLAEHMEREA